MREYSLSLKKALNNGLWPIRQVPRGNDFLATCYNLTPSPTGLEPFRPITMPFSESDLLAVGMPVIHPFPQLIRGKGITLLAGETAIFEVDESDWSLTPITIYNAYMPTVTKDITPGGPWHFVDFHDVWFLMNGSCVVFKSNLHNFGILPDEVFVQDEITIGTGTDFRGRMLTGGFNSSAFYTSDWKHLMGEFKGMLPDGVSAEEYIGNNFVVWTTIGGGDLFWPFYPSLAMESGESDVFSFHKTPFFEALKRNELGFMPMPWPGDVYNIKPLGKSAVVYGENGVAALNLVSEPIATFGLSEISSRGLLSRSAVGGNDNQHVFMDSAGYLCSLSQEGLRVLDYHEHFADMIEDEEEIVITYNERRNEFYICGETLGYVLTSKGLGSMYQVINSLVLTEDQIGISKDLEDRRAMIASGILDLGGGIKTITSVEVAGIYDVDLWVSIIYRFGSNDAFGTTEAIPLNSAGWARMAVSGTDLMVALMAEDFEGFDPDDVIVKWKTTDKRNIRGPSPDAG